MISFIPLYIYHEMKNRWIREIRRYVSILLSFHSIYLQKVNNQLYRLAIYQRMFMLQLSSISPVICYSSSNTVVHNQCPCRDVTMLQVSGVNTLFDENAA